MRFDKAIWVGVIAAATAMPLAVGAQDVGKAAPAFDIPSGGRVVRLAELKGRVVYVDFWASWCGPCKQSFPWMNDMLAKYADKGLTIVSVNVDKKREDADKFLASTPAKFAVVYDPVGKVAEKYQPKGMPTSFLIGPDGIVRAVHIGFRESDREELEREIAAALTASPRK
jgi:cytochrome c biogenesis protein CcmG/thiol:disulfide interchange protein DsbE